MKRMICFALGALLLTGCGSRAEILEESLERRMDTFGETVERMLTPDQTSASEVLTEAQAVDIALEHAGITREQADRLRTELDYDDGQPEYEVDFSFEGYEYDYKIHAQTGQILSWDRDVED